MKRMGAEARPGSPLRRPGPIGAPAASAAGRSGPEPAAKRDRTSAAATAVLECGSPLPLSFKPDGAEEARARIKPVEEPKSRPSTGRKGVRLIARRPAGPEGRTAVAPATARAVSRRFGRSARSGREPAARRDRTSAAATAEQW